MDFFIEFLDDVCSDDYLYYHVEDICAEIFLKGDYAPVCMIEYEEDTNVYLVNFRIGIEPALIAQITHTMTQHDPDIVFSNDFIVHHSKGILYGDEAISYYYMHVYGIMNNIIDMQKQNIEGATLVVQEPLKVYDKTFSNYSSKIKKLWLDEEF